MSYLLARVENFSRFDGENLSSTPVMGFGKSGETPHELHNFTIASDGLIYGCLPRYGGGDLRRLGGKKGAEEVSNVTVIFISDGVLCGFYKNATVLSSTVRHPDRLMAGNSEIFCRVKVNPKDAFLIPVLKRINKVEPRPHGMFPVLYGHTESDWVQWFEKFIQEGSAPLVSEKKRRKWTDGIERLSKARKMALNHYGNICECCGVSYGDNVRVSIFEVHHKVPYAEDFKTRTLNVSDLAVLCANCHRMIHKMPNIADIKDLSEYLKSV